MPNWEVRPFTGTTDYPDPTLKTSNWDIRPFSGTIDTNLVLYGSSVADSTLTTACVLSSQPGGVETSTTTIIPATANPYAEIRSQGGTSVAVGTLPPPTGNGWIFFPGQSGTYTADTWAAKHTHSSVNAGASTTIRFYRYNTGTYTAIGSITATQSVATKATYNYSATIMPAVVMGASDGIYIDMWWYNNSPNAGGDNPTNFISNSAAAGVAGDIEITPAAFILPPGTQSSKVLGVRTLIRSLATKTLNMRTLLRSQATKSVSFRALIRTIANRTLQVRARITTLSTRTLGARILLRSLATKTLPVRFPVRTGVVKSLIARTRLSTTGLPKTLQSLARIRTQLSRMVPTRFLMRTGVTRLLATRARIRSQVSKFIQVRSLVRTFQTRTMNMRTMIMTSHNDMLITRIRLRSQITDVVAVRAIIGVGGIASGKFALWANGAGTAQFDTFRVNEYPDPALSLAPLVPRIGATGVTWNAIVPNNTSLGVDISYDGVTWIDVSSGNGGSLPTFYSQPDPSIDSFSVSSSANYASTSRAGGSVGTWTFDSANSRIVATGGTNALYTSILLSRADVDFFVDLDQSDAGGVCWRFIDPNNFYYASIGDSLSSSTQNALVLYKVSAGVQTALGSTAIVFTRGTFHRLRVSMLASAIVVYFDGAQLLSVTDTGIPGAGRIGLYNNGGAVGSRYYQSWVQPQGDIVTGTPSGDATTGTSVYTRLRLATTDPSVTPQVEDIATFALSPQIGAGTIVPNIEYDATFTSKNIDDLAKQSNYFWFIDTAMMLTFHAFATIAAPWILQSTTAGLAVYSDIEVNSDLELDVENDLYRTRQIILGAQDTFVPPPETFVGDGNTRSFTLGYPLASAPTITLNGNPQTVALKGLNNANFYYTLNNLVIEQDSVSVVLQDTDVLSIAYTGLFDVTVVVDNLAEQAARKNIEGGTGIIESIVDMTGKGMLKSEAIALANQLIARYAIQGRTLIFDTSRPGLAIGQVLTIFLPEHGIWDGQFYIQSIEITLRKGVGDTQIWWYKVTASELPKKASWAKLIGEGLVLS
jgi:hypothetical protein